LKEGFKPSSYNLLFIDSPAIQV